MNKLTKALLATGLLSATFAVQAQEASIAANVALKTDYIYRGISQTSGGSAIQGGFDFVSESGFYVGTWASSITFDDSIEIDYYGGFRGALTEEVGYDIGVLYYDYPGMSSDDFVEVYGKVTYGSLLATINYSNDFYAGTGKAWYYTADYGIPLGGDVTLGLHYGYSDFDQNVFGGEDSYSDYNVSVSAPFAGTTLTLMYNDTSMDDGDCGSSDCEAAVVFGISKAF